MCFYRTARAENCEKYQIQFPGDKADIFNLLEQPAKPPKRYFIKTTTQTKAGNPHL